jgi:hypothetical protein
MTKTLNHIIFFSSTKIRIFFSEEVTKPLLVDQGTETVSEELSTGKSGTVDQGTDPLTKETLIHCVAEWKVQTVPSLHSFFFLVVGHTDRPRQRPHRPSRPLTPCPQSQWLDQLLMVVLYFYSQQKRYQFLDRAIIS